MVQGWKLLYIGSNIDNDLAHCLSRLHNVLTSILPRYLTSKQQLPSLTCISSFSHWWGLELSVMEVSFFLPLKDMVLLNRSMFSVTCLFLGNLKLRPLRGFVVGGSNSKSISSFSGGWGWRWWLSVLAWFFSVVVVVALDAISPLLPPPSLCFFAGKEEKVNAHLLKVRYD